jgi:hypothetical protein
MLFYSLVHRGNSDLNTVSQFKLKLLSYFQPTSPRHFAHTSGRTANVCTVLSRIQNSDRGFEYRTEHECSGLFSVFPKGRGAAVEWSPGTEYDRLSVCL